MKFVTALACAAALTAALQGSAQGSTTTYVKTVLGTVGTGSTSQAKMNDEAGQVTGDTDTQGTSAPTPFFWSQSTGMIGISTFNGAKDGRAAGKESSPGEVTGFADIGDPDGNAHAFSWTQNGGIVDLGTLGTGLDSFGADINNSGDIVGYSFTVGGFDNPGATHAFVYHPDQQLTDIDTFNSQYSIGLYINASGNIAGYYHPDGGGEHAFFWSSSTGMVDLGTLGGTTSRPTAINANDQIVGYSTTAAGDLHSFIWSPTTPMQDLGTLGIGSGLTTIAEDVNDHGVVVGQADTGNGT